MKTILNNRKAFFEYEILEKHEAGIVLKGTEIKSIVANRFNVGDAHCRISRDMELELINLHVSPYEYGNRFNHDPLRVRKLLMHKRQIVRLYRGVREKGVSLIPLRFYLSKKKLKVEIGLCRGKKLHDKRETIKLKDQKRDLERERKSPH